MIGFGNINKSTPKTFAAGKLQIYKVAPNTADVLEIGDVVQGVVQNNFITAVYTGGNPELLSSYDKINQIEIGTYI